VSNGVCLTPQVRCAWLCPVDVERMPTDSPLVLLVCPVHP
jgi:hypothetical protein